jgi:hypothetical protein
MHPLRAAILEGRTCRLLRQKGLYVSGDEGPPPHVLHAPDTAVFWCESTGWAMGPGMIPANPGRCVRERNCFEREPYAGASADASEGSPGAT